MSNVLYYKSKLQKVYDNVIAKHNLSKDGVNYKVRMLGFDHNEIFLAKELWTKKIVSNSLKDTDSQLSVEKLATYDSAIYFSDDIDSSDGLDQLVICLYITDNELDSNEAICMVSIQINVYGNSKWPGHSKIRYLGRHPDWVHRRLVWDLVDVAIRAVSTLDQVVVLSPGKSRHLKFWNRVNMQPYQVIGYGSEDDILYGTIIENSQIEDIDGFSKMSI